MKMTLKELKRLGRLEKVAIRSMDLSLYQAETFIEGQRCLIVGLDQRPLRSFSLLEMKKLLASLEVGELVLIHESAYDEMIGQPDREGGNTLELRLSAEAQPAPPWLN